MNISRKEYLEGTFFLLKNVIKIDLLTTHAESLSHQTAETLSQMLERAYDFAEEELKPTNRIGDLTGTGSRNDRIKTPVEFQRAWHKISNRGWLKICRPLSAGGLGFPETIGSAVAEIFLMFNPAFALHYILTEESANLVGQFGSESIRKKFGERLAAGEWTGALSCMERSGLVATPRRGHYVLRGTASAIVCGDHDLTDNIVQILPAEIREEEERAEGLFLIPHALDSDGILEDNHVRIAKKHHTLGIRGASVSDFEYGADGICKGYLLKYIDRTKLLSTHRLRFFHHTALLGPAKLANILALSNSGPPAASEGSAQSEDGNPSEPSEFPTSLKSIFWGLRGALYEASFFKDCGQHGAESQKGRFDALYRLYVQVLKVYAQKKALHHYAKGLDQIGIDGYVNECAFEQNLRDLLFGNCIGDCHAESIQRVVREIRNGDNRSVPYLVEEFKRIDPHTAKSDAMRFVIGTWQEYVGGLILLHDDCTRDRDGKSWQMHAERLLIFLGDVIVCYHLIRQGLEIESRMEALGVNFFNLESEIGKDREIGQLYDKILLALHFAQNELPLQESHIRIMQKKEYTIVG